MPIDGRVQGLNRDTFRALQGVQNPRQMTTTEARRLETAILRDNRVDAAEQDLIHELTSGRHASIQITAATSAGFNPSALSFGQTRGESRVIIDALKQVGSGYENLDAGSGTSTAEMVGLTADVVGIFDPTPLSDGVSGLISLGQGDFVGAGLSVVSMAPFFGDAVGKPAKIFQRLMRQFPDLGRVLRSVEDVPRLLNNLEKLGPANLRSLSAITESLTVINNMQKHAARAYSNPRWLQTARHLELPTDGPISFVPPKNWDINRPQRGPNRGLMDRYGNEWTEGRATSRSGDRFEWDVIPRNRNGGLANFSHDGSHVNVSPQGDVTHRGGSSR